MKRPGWLWLVFTQSLVAVLGSLYYGWFGDPVINIATGVRFPWGHGFTPCEMCRFARIFMYPILILSAVSLIKKQYTEITSMGVLVFLGIILESYQYRYQMTHSKSEIASAICGIGTGASCAATDVMYYGFITIPLLCLVAFVMIGLGLWYGNKQSNT